MKDSPLAPAKRIEVIDALRGFALLGIILVHSHIHFELYVYPEVDFEGLKWLDATFRRTVNFIFGGKAYGIFSLLFGLSFFIQMDNQAARGVDFRLQFVWRLVILYALGWVNGLFYQGDIIKAYALFGLLLIPLWKAPARWLWVLFLFFFFQAPALVKIGFLAFNPELAEQAGALRESYNAMNGVSGPVYQNGSLWEVFKYNAFAGHLQSWTWFLYSQYWCSIPGLFIGGMLIGRYGIHKDENKMMKYGVRAFWIGITGYVLFFCMKGLLQRAGFEGAELNWTIGNTLDHLINPSVMLVWVGLFVMCWFKLSGQGILRPLAPMGRMSLTNYMMQSVLGTFIFYGWGLGLAGYTGRAISVFIGFGICALQIAYSHWWLNRYHYGPVEWLWRSLTGLSFKTPFRRPTD